VGGHCIGVDPYYLTHKAQSLGYHPEVILAGRRINDSMAKHVANQVINLMMKKRIHVVDSRILVMGLTFKENCPDLRNSKVIDIINELKELHANVDVFDPWVNFDEANQEYGIRPVTQLNSLGSYDAVILTVAHQQIKDMGIELVRSLCKPEHVIYDVKYLFDLNQVDGRL
jgi:UDP-N-acetyl-D-galactosamine dehydrogenase